MDSLWKEIENESPRGVILVFAMFIEGAVRQLVRVSSVDETAGKQVAGDRTNISTMRNVAFAFGLISSDEAAAMKTIAEIRNKFAHHKDGFSGVDPFSNAEVRRLIEKLPIPFGSTTKTPSEARGAFSAACIDTLFRVTCRIRSARRRKPPAEQLAPMKTLLAPELLREAIATLTEQLPAILNTLPEPHT